MPLGHVTAQLGFESQDRDSLSLTGGVKATVSALCKARRLQPAHGQARPIVAPARLGHCREEEKKKKKTRQGVT